MKALVKPIKAVVICICLLYFFGQLFFGDFVFNATLIGVSGICTACFWNPVAPNKLKMIVSASCALLTITGFLLEASDYYSLPHVRGSNFGWGLRAPFYIAILWIFISSSDYLTRRYK